MMCYCLVIYWVVIVVMSMVGMMMFDFMDCMFGFGYVVGLLIFVVILLVIFVVWCVSGELLLVDLICICKVELFYWIVILFLNMFGIVFGDFFVDSLGFGFGGGVLLIGGLFVVIVFVYYFMCFFGVLLFWVVFVFMWLFGVMVGDLLMKLVVKGGFVFGMVGLLVVLLGVLVVMVVYVSIM